MNLMKANNGSYQSLPFGIPEMGENFYLKYYHHSYHQY
jgi:hypothetical protein